MVGFRPEMAQESACWTSMVAALFGFVCLRERAEVLLGIGEKDD